MEISKKKRRNEIVSRTVSAIFSYFNRSIRIIFNGTLASVQNKQGTAVATANQITQIRRIFSSGRKKKRKGERERTLFFQTDVLCTRN